MANTFVQISSRVADLSIANNRIDGHNFKYVVCVQQNFFPREIQQRAKQNEFVINFFPNNSRNQSQQTQAQISHSHSTIEDDGERENVEKNFASDFDVFLQHLIQAGLAAVQLLMFLVFQIIEMQPKNHMFLA